VAIDTKPAAIYTESAAIYIKLAVIGELMKICGREIIFSWGKKKY